jgi:transposase InsO family protein
MQAVKLLKLGWSTRQVARYLGFNQSTIVKWKKKDPLDGRLIIPTKSSRPKSHPHSLSLELIQKIIETRVKYNRCSEVVHQELINQGIKVSLSSVKRTLDRNYLIKKRSPWKRQHFNQPRPSPVKPGDLVQIDTIHLMKNQSQRIYIYTLIDVYSRWAYATAAKRISAGNTVKFITQAKKRLPFEVSCLQSDHGSEFSQHFTNKVRISHRHSRVRRPNDNAHLERFNRTIQEELLDRLPRDVKTINQVLPRYLKYYNEQRLHLGLNLKTPLQVMPSY